MTVNDVIGGFVSGNILPSVFESFLYENMGLFEGELPSDIFLELISLDFTDDNGVLHMKNILREHYGDMSAKYNDAFFERAAESGEPLSELIDRPERPEVLVFECGGISSARELHMLIKKMLRFPSRYGMNWDAFNDLVCLGGVREIVLHGFEDMRRHIPEDADIFLSILDSRRDVGCVVTIA